MQRSIIPPRTNLPVTFGPDLPFTQSRSCCGAARRTGHSSIVQHFRRVKVGCADFSVIRFLHCNCPGSLL